MIRDAYFQENMVARKEYKMMYPEEAQRYKGNKMEEKGMYKYVYILF